MATLRMAAPFWLTSRRPSLAAQIFMLLVAALVLAPIAGVLWIALGHTDIWEHIITYVLPVALYDTLILLVGVGLLTALIGVSTAWTVTTLQFPGRDLFVWLLPLALAFPTYIVAYVYVDMFEALGPVSRMLRFLFGPDGDRWVPSLRSLGGAIFVISFVLYPYVYLAARATFQTQSPLLIDAARNLGATPLNLAREVTFPLARPAIAVGLSLVLLETLNDIGASEYLGVRTLTVSIFTTWLNRGSLPGAAQIACVMLLAVAGLMALERYGRRQQQFLMSDRTPRGQHRIVVRGGRSIAAIAVCIVPVALGFFLPLGYLIHQVAVRNMVMGFDASLIGHTMTTLWLAGMATVSILILGFGVAIAARAIASRLGATCLYLAGWGYAIPGTVLALGLLAPLVFLDELINLFTRATMGVQVGLLLAGSGAGLIIAYTIRFLTIAIGFGQSALARISLELDDAARTLGARTLAVVRGVHLPLAQPALWGAALLIFVDCLKELPATLLLRPLNVETLSTYIYQFATRGNFEEGAMAALLIVLVGIVPLIWMVRHADERLAAVSPDLDFRQAEGRPRS